MTFLLICSIPPPIICKYYRWFRMIHNSKLTKEDCGFIKEEPIDLYQHQYNIIDEPYSDDRISSLRLTSNASSHSKASSESCWDESLGQEPKMTRERRGRRAAVSAAQSITSGKGISISDHAFSGADDENQYWNMESTVGGEMTASSMMSQAALHVLSHYTSSHDIPQTSDSDCILSIPRMHVSPGSQQRVVDNSGAAPIPFYPTGPPVPFLTMVPVSYFSTET